jgi:hypothetical protein
VVDGWRRSNFEAVGAGDEGWWHRGWEGRRFFVRADQRLPHRIQQGSKPGCDRDTEESDRQGQYCACGHEGARFHASHRRHHAELESSRVRTASQVIKGFKNEVFYLPGEHDYIDDGTQYKQRFGKGTLGNGWYSYNHKGVHFVGLNNCVQVDAMGNMGEDQLKWLKSDLAGLSHSTPIVVFAHIPLWMVYEKWGWGTKDGEQALAMLKPFGSVTVLNGHIHQVVQKVEGNVAFHTAMATAFPQPAPGAAPNPGPMMVPAGKLESALGVTKVKVFEDIIIWLWLTRR